jgi:predicted RNA-binding protein Jag
METIEVIAGTVEEAIGKAEAQLGLKRDQFKVEIIREGRSGILGMGGREAVIRVSAVTLSEEDIVDGVREILDTLLALMDVQGKV